MGSGRGESELHDLLLARRDEIERAILTRVYGISDPTEVGDPTYIEGLRTAVLAAIDYSLAAIQSGERSPPPIPPALLVQARTAARSGVSLDTVLRRYFAGYALLGDFLIEEGQPRLQRLELRRLLRRQAGLFDRLVAAVSEEHRRDERHRLDRSESRRLELARRLLAGERLETADLAYELETTHLGVVAQGPDVCGAMREISARIDRKLLLVYPDERTAWGWLGGRAQVDLPHLQSTFRVELGSQSFLALGEPGEGIGGWRLTHRQARAALPIAQRGPEPVIRYAEVALMASVLQDDLLVKSLCSIYLAPLERERDGGVAALRTLRAYLDSGGNATSAAAALGVNRNTIANRLRAIEEAIGRPLDPSSAELQAALRLQELDAQLPIGG